MIMTEQAKITALDNRAYFLVTDEDLVTDAEGNRFPVEQEISSTVLPRCLDQQAVSATAPTRKSVLGRPRGWSERRKSEADKETTYLC
jgi:hypothetical protein